jgi:hypothetical protein
LRFRPEAGLYFRFSENSGGEHLNSDVAIKVLVSREIHHTHSTRAELPYDSIVRNAFANHSTGLRYAICA